MKGIVRKLTLMGAVVLMCQGLSALAQQETPRAAAVVNGETITVGEVDALIASRGPLPVEISADKRKGIQREALAMLIDKVLLEQFLRQHAPKVDPAEVGRKLTELNQAVKKAGKTMEDYYRDTKQSAKDVQMTITQILQWEGYARSRVSDADVKRYYDECKDFFDGVTVRASHILIRVPSTATDAEKQATRQQLLALRQQIISNQISFADAAKKYSHCPSGAKDSGDIGSFPRKMVVEENFAKAAFAMQVGQVSDVVSTDFGLHLIKVTERKPGEQPSEYSKIKDVVRDFCVEELRQNVLAHQRQTAKLQVFLGQ